MTERLVGLDEVLEILIEQGTLPDRDSLFLAYVNSLTGDARKTINFEYGETIVKSQIDEFLNSRLPQTPNADMFFDEEAFVPKRMANFLMGRNFFRTDSNTKWIYMYYPDEGIYKDDGEPYIRAEVERILDERVKTHYVQETVDSIMRSTYFSISSMNPPDTVCLSNGLFNLTTGEFRNFTPDVVITVKIPVAYVAGVDCPNFKKFLSEILNEADTPAVQELFGFLLYKRYSIKKAFIFHGETDAGKTMLINQIIKFLGGSENIACIPIQRLSDNFRLVNLFGKLANTCDDMGAKVVADTGNFKMLTGDSPIAGNIKYVQKDRIFYNFAKMIFACNKIPPVHENTDDAYYNRIFRIGFPYRFVKEPKEPNEKQRRPAEDIEREISSSEEMSGIFNWAIEGLRRLLEQQDFTGDKSIDEKRLEYAYLTNPTQSFKETELALEPSCETLKDDIYLSFCAFCVKNRFATVSNVAFFTELKKLFAYEFINGVIAETQPRVGDKRKLAWNGIKLVHPQRFAEKEGKDLLPLLESIQENNSIKGSMEPKGISGLSEIKDTSEDEHIQCNEVGN